MLAVLSPAKTLDFSPPEVRVDATRPHFVEDARVIHTALKAMPAAKLRRLMKLSATKAKTVLAELARTDPATSEGGLPAVQAFGGEVFRGMRARTLGAADLTWAQDRVAIISGLYGLLRPLDRIHPHRLEMATRIPTSRGHNLYAHWGERLSQQANARLAGHRDPSLICLASQEYAKALWPRSLVGPWVDVVFENWKDAARTPHTIPTPTRHARGAMARWIIERRAETVSDLFGFDVDRYRYIPDRSSPHRLVFGRTFAT